MIRRPPRSTPLSLHDALPISELPARLQVLERGLVGVADGADRLRAEERGAVVHDNETTLEDRKSTRLNSSHSQISYAVFCLKKKKKKNYKSSYSTSHVKLHDS